MLHKEISDRDIIVRSSCFLKKEGSKIKEKPLSSILQEEESENQRETLALLQQIIKLIEKKYIVGTVADSEEIEAYFYPDKPDNIKIVFPNVIECKVDGEYQRENLRPIKYLLNFVNTEIRRARTMNGLFDHAEPLIAIIERPQLKAIVDQLENIKTPSPEEREALMTNRLRLR